MARRTRTARPVAEDFRFAVETWTFEYGVHLNRNKRLNDLLGCCWESHWLILRGPLQSTTRRRIAQVELLVRPGLPDPDTWKPEWTGFGAVMRVRDGILVASLSVPALAFHSLLISLGANKTKHCLFSVDDMSPPARRITDFSAYESVDESE